MMKVRSILVLACLVQTMPVASAEPLNAEVYAALPDADNVRLSPNGKAVVMLAPHDHRLGIQLWHPDGSQDWFMPGGSDRVNWVEWKNDDRLLISLRYTESDHDRLRGATRLIVTGADNNDAVTINFPEPAPDPQVMTISREHYHPPAIQDRVISMLPGDHDHILLAVAGQDWAHPAVVLVDTKRGQPFSVMRPAYRVIRWLADPEGEVRLAVSREALDGHRSRLIVRVRDKGGSDWAIVQQGELDRDPRFIPLAFSPRSPTTLFVLADQANGRLALQEFDVKTRLFGPVLAADPVCDIDPILRDNQILGFVDPCKGPGVTYLDAEWRKDQAELRRFLQTEIVELIDRSADGKYALVKSAPSPTAPPSYWYFNESGAPKTLARIADSRRALTGAVAPSRWVTLPARDGLTIPALLTLPVNAPEGPMGFVVLPHGGPTAHDEEQFDWIVQFLASRGYGVLQPQFRGSSGFGAAFQRAGYRQWGAAMQDDVTDATRWLIDQRLADPTRICLVGASYGGYSALLGAAQHPELYRCAAAIAPVTDIERLLHDRDRNEFAEVNRDRVVGDDDPETVPAPIKLAAGMTVPVLLIHGKLDFTVPPAHSEEMERRLRQAGRSVTAVYLDQADHYLSRAADRLTCLKALESFLGSALEPVRTARN